MRFRFQDEVPIWFEKKEVDCVLKEKHVDKEISEGICHKRITLVTKAKLKKCVDEKMLAYQEASLMLLAYEDKEKIEVSQVEAVKSSSEEDPTMPPLVSCSEEDQTMPPLASSSDEADKYASSNKRDKNSTRKRRQGKKSKKKQPGRRKDDSKR